MPVEAVIAVASFVALFVVWVVLPSYIRKLHSSKEETQIDGED